MQATDNTHTGVAEDDGDERLWAAVVAPVLRMFPRITDANERAALVSTLLEIGVNAFIGGSRHEQYYGHGGEISWHDFASLARVTCSNVVGSADTRASLLAGCHGSYPDWWCWPAPSQSNAPQVARRAVVLPKTMTAAAPITFASSKKQAPPQPQRTKARAKSRVSVSASVREIARQEKPEPPSRLLPSAKSGHSYEIPVVPQRQLQQQAAKVRNMVRVAQDLAASKWVSSFMARAAGSSSSAPSTESIEAQVGPRQQRPQPPHKETTVRFAIDNKDGEDENNISDQEA